MEGTFDRSRLLTIALPIILFIAGISVTCSGSTQTLQGGSMHKGIIMLHSINANHLKVDPNQGQRIRIVVPYARLVDTCETAGVREMQSEAANYQTVLGNTLYSV
jgi:hypothetical protein